MILLGAFALVGAATNKVFYFGTIGMQDRPRRRMPTWLARIFLVAATLFFWWAAYKTWGEGR